MNKYIECNLQLFAEGGEGVSGTGEVAAGSMVSMETNSQSATDNGATTTNGSTEDAKQRASAFQELINGEYKAEYQALLEKTLGRRLRNKDAQIAEYDEYKGKVSPLFDKLAVKYGITDVNNIDAIMQAVDKDNSYYEEYAMQNGVSVEQAKALIQAERITAEAQRRQVDEQRQQEFTQQYNGWLRQAAATQEKYPAFDFEYESINEETGEQFRRLLNSGVDVETAYTILHRNEIMGGAMHYAYQSAQQEMADARTARKARVNENGTSYQQASAAIDDWTKLSKSENEKIKAAVRRGEKINAENFRKFL